MTDMASLPSLPIIHISDVVAFDRGTFSAVNSRTPCTASATSAPTRCRGALGAVVTGMTSPTRRWQRPILAERVGVKATFVETELYGAPGVPEQFDCVYTSVGRSTGCPTSPSGAR